MCIRDRSKAVPPAPLQVTVYVFELPAVGSVMVVSVPLTVETLKSAGLPEQLVASVDCQCRPISSPFTMFLFPGEYEYPISATYRVTVGAESDVLVMVRLSETVPPGPVHSTVKVVELPAVGSTTLT